MKKTLLRNKKGQLGMDVAKSFMLGLMTLLVIGVVVLIITTSLSDTNLALDEFSVSNETLGIINTTGDNQVDQASVYGFTSFSVTEARTNDGVTIPTANYTVSSSGEITNATSINQTSSNYDNAQIDYNYEANNEVVSVTDNSSAGISDFFEDTSTWLALLGVAIIILIIAVVISVVNRFGQEGRSKGGSGGVTF